MVTGLGAFKDLEDDLILQIMHLVDARTLTQCSAVSKAFYCFCTHEEVWRALTLQASTAVLASCESLMLACRT